MSSSSSIMNGNNSNKSEKIACLIQYAQTSYHENPTEALSALLQAMTLNNNGNKDETNRTIERIRNDLGTDIANHIQDKTLREERAKKIVEKLLADTSTLLYKKGQEHILKQTMEDGSSVVCIKCNSVVASNRWQQHQQYWCSSIKENENEKESPEGNNDSNNNNTNSTSSTPNRQQQQQNMPLSSFPLPPLANHDNNNINNEHDNDYNNDNNNNNSDDDDGDADSMAEEYNQRQVQETKEEKRNYMLRHQILSDGSSVICGKCHMVVQNRRWEQHEKYWCTQAIHKPNFDDDSDDSDMDI